MLLDSDHSTGGQYRSDLDDPDLCQPKATTLWELSLLAVSTSCSFKGSSIKYKVSLVVEALPPSCEAV